MGKTKISWITHHKKIREYLVRLSRSKSSAFWKHFFGDTTLKCAETSKGTTFCKGISTWPLLVDLCVSVSWSYILFLYSLISVASYSISSRPLNTFKVHQKSSSFLWRVNNRGKEGQNNNWIINMWSKFIQKHWNVKI